MPFRGGDLEILLAWRSQQLGSICKPLAYVKQEPAISLDIQQSACILWLCVKCHDTSLMFLIVLTRQHQGSRFQPG